MRIFRIILLIFLTTSCQKESISIGEKVCDTFYLDNAGASMRVQVEGNTKSNIFLILVNGGPGESAYFYKTDYIQKNLENNAALVYWDQRNAGASQGNSNSGSLTLSQMTDDLKKLVQLIKSRYGQQSSVFILGHSFGGLLTSSFMTNPANQSMIKGWIVVDGSHDYALNDSLTRQKLLNTGKEEVNLKRNIDFWDEVINYCQIHTGPFILSETHTLESYAEEAETLMDPVKDFDMIGWIQSNAIQEQIPITSVLINYLYSSQSGLNEELQKTEFSSSLSKVNIPTLLLYGKYDFIY
jgi:pimeloyl-ACP methyl ester carboxylesterase